MRAAMILSRMIAVLAEGWERQISSVVEDDVFAFLFWSVAW